MRAAVLTILAACLCGCTGAPVTSVPPGAVFRSGWEATITHVGVTALSSVQFASANYLIALRLRASFPGMKVEAFLAPHPDGYDVVILSSRPLTKEESDRVSGVVFTALDDAKSGRTIHRDGKVG